MALRHLNDAVLARASMLAVQALGDVRQRRHAAAASWTALEADLELTDQLSLGIDESALRLILI
jgi:hypothetical protein